MNFERARIYTKKKKFQNFKRDELKKSFQNVRDGFWPPFGSILGLIVWIQPSSAQSQHKEKIVQWHISAQFLMV